MHLILYPVPSNPLKRDVGKPEENLQRLLRRPRTRVEGWGLTASYSFGKDSYNGDGPKLFLLAPGDKNFQTFSLDSRENIFIARLIEQKNSPPREVEGSPWPDSPS